MIKWKNHDIQLFWDILHLNVGVLINVSTYSFYEQHLFLTCYRSIQLLQLPFWYVLNVKNVKRLHLCTAIN